MKLVKVTGDAWRWSFSEAAHKAVFGKLKPAERDRIDFAYLFVKEETDKPIGYVTCRETDSETVYWQYGGILEAYRNSTVGLRVVKAALDMCLSEYERVHCLIENDNRPMLGLALKAGMKITGLRTYGTSVLLEHVKERGN